MKKIGVLLLVLACILGCTGCICSHQWVEADCLTPKTCPLCGKTEGQAPGHRWQEATCLVPQTCGICKLTQGETVDHSWSDATCTAPKTCRWCGLTEGEMLNHNWEKATTEAPRTCTYCNATEGERIVTDERFTTGANQMLFGQWTTETVMAGEDLNLESFVEQVPVVMTLVFGEDGSMEKRLSLQNPEAFLEELVSITEERLYAQFEEMDIDRETADEMFADAYDMTISEYAAQSWASADLDGMLNVHGIQGVYYASEGLLNTAANWTLEFTANPFAVEDGTLTITNPDGTAMVLTRMEE